MLSVGIVGIMLVAAILIAVGVGGFVLASAFSAKQRSNVDHLSNDPPLVRDLSNPYAPTSVGGRPTKSSRNGLVITIAALLIVGICVLAFAATYFLRATSGVKIAPMPPVSAPATPPPVVQPQSPPTSPT